MLFTMPIGKKKKLGMFWGLYKHLDFQVLMIFVASSAAAYSQQGDHEKAVSDAEKAIEVDPKYSKAYSRMG